MKRLTRRSEITKAAYFPNCFEGCDGVCANCDEETNYCETLAKYEDTGLTPEQIVEMDKLYSEKCRELAECWKQLQKTWIQCSERLPEDTDMTVLVQVSGNPRQNITLDNALELAAYNPDDGWILEEYPEWKEAEPIAWMPLPALYKESYGAAVESKDSKRLAEREAFFRD